MSRNELNGAPFRFSSPVIENTPHTLFFRQASEKIARLERAGVDRVMMQMQAHEDLELVHVLGRLAGAVA